ncbi:MAG: Lpg1974 family pore-forming outer membrane protein [Simkaniaceae bacterium]|nr:Lpg1974 family pore-forming outer membrane protein [Candidatus Sacchlamyda saccharinae]
MRILLVLLPLTSLAAYDCCCEDPCMDWEFSISPVVWQVHEEGLDYAKGKKVDQDWAWGVRLNLAYDTCYSGILELDWTYYRTTEKSTCKNAIPTWSNHITSFDRMRADTKLLLNLLDLRLGAEFFPNCYLTFHPFIALSTVWLDQDFIIHGQNETIPLHQVKMRNDFWGIGPKIGLKTEWLLGCGFSFFGNADATLFYGDFSVRQKATSAPLIKDNFWLSRAYLDFILGIQWEWIFCSNDYSIGFAAGWENLFFFGQNQLRLGGHPIKGDLTLQGLTLTGSFGF